MKNTVKMERRMRHGREQRDGGVGVVAGRGRTGSSVYGGGGASDGRGSLSSGCGSDMVAEEEVVC